MSEKDRIAVVNSRFIGEKGSILAKQIGQATQEGALPISALASSS